MSISKRLKPYKFVDNIYQINIEQIKKDGINTLLFDLDNTLIPFYEKLPSEKVISFINYLKANGINSYVVSNNHYDRVKEFADALGVNFSYMSYKPLTFKLNKFLKNQNLKKNEVCLVGDQLLTDVVCAKFLKIKVILTTPACDDDLKKTKLNRFFDNKIRRKQAKKGLLERFDGGNEYEY